MYDLLKYLKEKHARWQPLSEELMNTNRSTLVKAMYMHLIRFRKKTEYAPDRLRWCAVKRLR